MIFKQTLPNILIHLLSLGAAGVAIAAIVVIRSDLWKVGSSSCDFFGCYYYDSEDVCFMATESTSVNLCLYAYWVTGFSIFLSISLMFAQCFIRERRSYMLSTLGLTLVGTIWWFGFAITATAYGVSANQAQPPVPYESSRNTAFILGWVNAALFAAALVVGMLVVGGCLAGQLQEQPNTLPSYPQGAYMAPGYTAGPGYAAGYAVGTPAYPQQPYGGGQPQGQPYGGPNPYAPPPPPATGYPQQQQQQL